jgi:CTP synthase (UTP-ammonia lyase)
MAIGAGDPRFAAEVAEADDPVTGPWMAGGQLVPVRVTPGTLAAELYQADETVEPYFCTFGLNPRYREPLERWGLRFTGFDGDGEPRILELPGHRFFLATLYVPQAAPAQHDPHPVIAGFLKAAAG